MEVDGFDAHLCERLVREFSTNLIIACVRDREIVRKWVGAAAAEVYGYDSEELESNPMLWLDVVHPADKARVSAAFDRLMSGESFVQEYRIFRSDGQMQWVRDCYTAACDSEGSVVRLIGLATGVSSERADIDNLLQFKNVLDAAPSAAAIGDLSGQVLYCNDALARILGFESPDEMIGRNFVEVVPEEPPPAELVVAEESAPVEAAPDVVAEEPAPEEVAPEVAPVETAPKVAAPKAKRKRSKRKKKEGVKDGKGSSNDGAGAEERSDRGES